MPTVMILEEDAALRQRLCRLLCADGIEILDVPARGDVMRAVASAGLDLIIVGSSAQGPTTSLDIARQVRRAATRLPIIFIAPNSSEQLAIAALRAGVTDYFPHPVSFDEVASSVKRLAKVAAPSLSLTPSAVNARMIGAGPRMEEIHTYIDQVAALDSTILITGETGTGKELTATLLHAASRRRDRPLARINCAAIPDTLLESELFGYERGAFTGAGTSSAGKLKLADGGTVFFDEIGDMSIYAQAKILRLIETREIERLGGRGSLPVDIRVIAATNQALERLMAEGRFRKDLYFRLNVARIHLPALRERKEDLPALLDHYVREFNTSLGREIEGFTDDALDALVRHDWPGNIRELRNLVEGQFVAHRSGRIGLSALPEVYRRRGGDARAAGPDGERDQLLAALAATRWNKSRAATRLHWSRMTVYRKIAKYHLAGSDPSQLT